MYRNIIRSLELNYFPINIIKILLIIYKDDSN